MKKTTGLIIVLLLAAIFTYIIRTQDTGDTFVDTGVQVIKSTTKKVADTAKDGVEAIEEGVEELEENIEDIVEEDEDDGETGEGMDDNDAEEENNEAPLADDLEEAQEKQDAIEESDDDAVEEVVAVYEGYEEFTPASLDKAITNGKQVALFFHAGRCPSCKNLDQNITENKANVSEDQLIFKVDYDTAVELKETYGVTAQHTIVYLDENKDAAQITRGTPSLDALLAGF